MVSAEAAGLDFLDLYPRLLEEDRTTEIYVLSALERLTPQQQRVILLRFWADLSVKEIAVWLEISVCTVKTHINDALTKLRPVLVDKECTRQPVPVVSPLKPVAAMMLDEPSTRTCVRVEGHTDGMAGGMTPQRPG